MKKLLVMLCAVFAGVPAVANEFIVGQSIDLSGRTAEHGKAVQSGIELFISSHKNAFGKNRVVLKTLDDGGDAKRAGANAQRLIEKDKANVLFGGIEGGPCVAQLKVATELKVPLIGCMGGAPELRAPFNRYSFPVRAGHFTEFEQLLTYAKSNGLDKVAFVHADNDNGRSHLANVGKLTKKLGIADVISVPATAGADGKPDLRVMADRIVKAQAKGVFNHGSYVLYAELIRILRGTGKPIQIMAVNSGAQQMIEALGNEGKGIIFTQVVPFPFSDSKPLVGEYRKALSVRNPKAQPSFSELEGYMTAKALAEGLKRATRPTTESIISAFESLTNADIGGVVIRYGATAHDGADFVETVIASSDGKFRR